MDVDIGSVRRQASFAIRPRLRVQARRGRETAKTDAEGPCVSGLPATARRAADYRRRGPRRAWRARRVHARRGGASARARARPSVTVTAMVLLRCSMHTRRVRVPHGVMLYGYACAGCGCASGRGGSASWASCLLASVHARRSIADPGAASSAWVWITYAGQDTMRSRRVIRTDGRTRIAQLANWPTAHDHSVLSTQRASARAENSRKVLAGTDSVRRQPLDEYTYRRTWSPLADPGVSRQCERCRHPVRKGGILLECNLSAHAWALRTDPRCSLLSGSGFIAAGGWKVVRAGDAAGPVELARKWG